MTFSQDLIDCGEFTIESIHNMTVTGGLHELKKAYLSFEKHKYAGGKDQCDLERWSYERRNSFFRPVRNASNAFWTAVRPITTVLLFATIEAILALLTPIIIAAGIISLLIAILSAPFDLELAINAWEFSTGSAASTFVSLVAMAGLALAIVVSPISDIIALITRTLATVADAVDDCVNSERPLTY